MPGVCQLCFCGFLNKAVWGPRRAGHSYVLVKTVRRRECWPLVFPSLPLSHPYIVWAANPSFFSEAREREGQK